MNMLMGFKKFHNKILVHMKTFDVTIDHILDHFVGSKLELYVSFLIPLYFENSLRFPIGIRNETIADVVYFSNQNSDGIPYRLLNEFRCSDWT